MGFKFTAERNAQILISLLKQNGIKKVVASPGATNLNFVVTCQHDSFFEVFSCVDERSAAYMACGLSWESGEPVVISCTGATASRNYFPGLSEAFYRKLPIVAVTASQDISNTNNLSAQYVDRSVQPKDTVVFSVHLQNIKDKTDEWDCNLKVNRALSYLKKNGGGPVHINLSTGYCNDSVDEIPNAKKIDYYTVYDKLPQIPNSGKIAVSVGAHRPWDGELTDYVESFCEKYNAVVFVDHSSGYRGKYAINPAIIAAQEKYESDIFNIDLLIHIGELHGDYYTNGKLRNSKKVWRISGDGMIKDPFRKIAAVFEMTEKYFFSLYADVDHAHTETGYYRKCKNELDEFYGLIPELPLSNIYVAKTISQKLPEDSVIQLGVSNTMRSWTFFQFQNTIKSIANVGCRGIDGTLSTVCGMSLVNPNKLYFCVLGDLTFFYDMNALGNRHVGNNLRILLVNNGKGTEFRIYQHRAQRLLDNEADEFVAAARHYGNKSSSLVKHYVSDLGFKYLSASSKEEFQSVLNEFLNPEIGDKPVLLEVFTECDKESEALKTICNLKVDSYTVIKSKAKSLARGILSEQGINMAKEILHTFKH